MSLCPSPARYCYSIYGVRVTSDLPFEFPSDSDPDASSAPLAHVEFVEGSHRDFQPFTPLNESDTEFVCRPLPGGPTYLRWPHWRSEFSVAADGSRVACRPLRGCDRGVLQNFLFGQALAVALVHQGIEPLHAAVVCLDAGAVGFLGDCTFGKSTLLATFLQAGHRVLTDDLLLLDQRAGAHRGASRFGSHQAAAGQRRQFMSDSDGGTPLNPLTTKRSFRVDASTTAGQRRAAAAVVRAARS